MTSSITGVFGPVITTFDRRGELDLDAFGANLKGHIAAGLDGVVVAGSTGEAALLEEGERQRLVEMARSVIPTTHRLIVGTGAESTKACVRRCREAGERGASAALVVAPHYYANAMTNASLQAHYERVADESPIPILLYNIPKYMHFKLEPALVNRLAEHDNIVGMKDSSGDLETLAKYLGPLQRDHRTRWDVAQGAQYGSGRRYPRRRPLCPRTLARRGSVRERQPGT